MDKDLQLKQYEYYINNMLDYLYGVWSIDHTDEEIIEKFKKLFGFTNADLRHFDLEVE